MTATAATLIHFLNSVPADSPVTIRIDGEERDINSLIRTEQVNPENGDVDTVGPVVLSGNYYGA